MTGGTGMGRWDEGKPEWIGVCCMQVLKHQAESHCGIKLMHAKSKAKKEECVTI